MHIYTHTYIHTYIHILTYGIEEIGILYKDLRCNQTNATRLKASKSDCFQCRFSNVKYTGYAKFLSVALARF